LLLPSERRKLLQDVMLTMFVVHKLIFTLSAFALCGWFNGPDDSHDVIKSISATEREIIQYKHLLYTPAHMSHFYHSHFDPDFDFM
jgi:hypothetical protein